MDLPPPTMSYLTDIYFENGALAFLPELLEKFQIHQPLVMTDRGIIESGLFAQFPITPHALFDDVQTNPSGASALAAVQRYHAQNCDGIIAFGGGAPIDLAKIVAMLVHHPPPLRQYAIIHGGVPRITGNVPPLIAIPTTAGSGSEVGRAALVTLSNGEKLGFLSPHLLPKTALCDPELTRSLPPRLTAATGMDAISHCIETFLSTRMNPAADALALDGLHRGFGNIEMACQNPLDLRARSEMMLCSLLAGLAFQKGLGAVHSLSHPLGGLTEKKLHHGTLNAIFLPHVLRFNAPRVPEKFSRLAKILNVSPESLPDTFTQLNSRLHLPANLAALGVTSSDLEPLAAKAAADHCSPTNPRPLTPEDCNALYESAL